jgi:hypothetical protein
MRRSVALSMLLLATPSAARSEPEAPRIERPNILFILADNLGFGEVGAYGGGATRARTRCRSAAWPTGSPSGR